MTEDEILEIESAIELIENPEEHNKIFEEPIRFPLNKKIKVGRNEPCPCGSGKKYKKCCLNKEIK